MTYYVCRKCNAFCKAQAGYFLEVKKLCINCWYYGNPIRKELKKK